MLPETSLENSIKTLLTVPSNYPNWMLGDTTGYRDDLVNLHLTPSSTNVTLVNLLLEKWSNEISKTAIDHWNKTVIAKGDFIQSFAIGEISLLEKELAPFLWVFCNPETLTRISTVPQSLPYSNLIISGNYSLNKVLTKGQFPYGPTVHVFQNTSNYAKRLEFETPIYTSTLIPINTFYCLPKPVFNTTKSFSEVRVSNTYLGFIAEIPVYWTTFNMSVYKILDF